MCGVIDKTVEVTTPAPPKPKPDPPPPCRHEWETVEKTKLGTETEYKSIVVLKCIKCGDLDKTVESVKIPPPPTPPSPPQPRSECRHKWVIDKNVTIDSAFEQIAKSEKSKAGNRPTKEKVEIKMDETPRWMFRKTFISLRTCSTCGEIDKTIASNFEEGEEETEAEE
jgi:hypothetical protein